MTSGLACSLDDILDSGLLSKVSDTFIACDRLLESQNAASLQVWNNNCNIINGA